MIGEFDNSFDFATNILEAGAYFREPATNPEALPIHLSTAHNVNDLDDLQKRYDESGFCYNRYRNPNRTALNDLMTYIENGKASGSYNSGMAAICAAIISNTKAGDLTIQGRRENVFVMREEGNQRKTYRVNLLSGRELLSSPAYYLQQNDVVYVEPNDYRARQTQVNGNNVLAAPFWISVASLLTSVAVLIVK